MNPTTEFEESHQRAEIAVDLSDVLCHDLESSGIHRLLDRMYGSDQPLGGYEGKSSRVRKSTPRAAEASECVLTA